MKLPTGWGYFQSLYFIINKIDTGQNSYNIAFLEIDRMHSTLKSHRLIRKIVVKRSLRSLEILFHLPIADVCGTYIMQYEPYF